MTTVAGVPSIFAVVAGGSGDDAALKTFPVKAQKHVHSAAQLECAGQLHVFCLDIHQTSKNFVQLCQTDDRCPDYVGLDAFSGFFNLSDC